MCKSWSGSVVLIPTLPEESIRTFSTPAGAKYTSLPIPPSSTVPEGSLNSTTDLLSVLSNLAATLVVPLFTSKVLVGLLVPIPTLPS